MGEYLFFKNDTSSEEERQAYDICIEEFADYILEGRRKKKRLLIITGSGISGTVPGMNQLMEKLCDLIENTSDRWERSDVFQRIFEEYKEGPSSERYQSQSKLLTYVQNAYLEKEHYVQEQDQAYLKKIWEEFVEWLLFGEKGNAGYQGVITADATDNHFAIRELYKEGNAISITTNFDNLLKKAFDEDAFYPILDEEVFQKYFCSEEDDGSYVEIQSRGDAFWMKCTGKKNKTCPNRNRQCYVPKETQEDSGRKILCQLCGSEAKIYFAFPGMKEKDEEMSQVIDGVWKYLANSLSCVLVTGSSMDYDPVLVEFLRELLQKRKLPVLYICSDRIGRKETYSDEKAATKMLFGGQDSNNRVWIKAHDTSSVLRDILEKVRNGKEKDKKVAIRIDEGPYYSMVSNFFQTQSLEVLNTLNGTTGFTEINSILELEPVRRLKYFSQLGLKTYWLRGTTDAKYLEHNRLNHSVGVLLLASYLYLKIYKKKPEIVGGDLRELQFLQIAALFHDIGHLPFSHLMEEVFEEFGWVIAGEKKSFDHEQHTKNVLRQLVEADEMKKVLQLIDFQPEEIQRLIDGEYGRGFLDALINSPIDCDKIEYLFADAIFTGKGTEEDFQNFIKAFSSDLSVNREGFLLLKGESTSRFLELIRMRGNMYDQVYLRPGLRYLEACCKLIIRTFIAYKCADSNVLKKVEDRDHFREFYNLSDVKVAYTIQILEQYVTSFIMDGKRKKSEEGLNGDLCELYVIGKMVKEIHGNAMLSNRMKAAVEVCYELIQDTNSEAKVKEIETERIVTFEVKKRDVDMAYLNSLIKNVYLRFPGVVLVDFVPSKASLSFGKRELRNRRRDGSKSATENILIKDICQTKGERDEPFKCLGDAKNEINEELHYPVKNYISIYRISDDRFYYMQAEDYILFELRKEGVIDGY